MSRIRRRETSVFSLAFLDCICCGFGAIILIFVLSIDSKEKEKMQTLLDLRQALASQIADLQNLRASKENLDRSNARVATLVTDARLRNDEVHALLDDLENKLANEKKGKEALLVDVDDLKKEIAARQKKVDLELKLPETKPAPVGLPVGGNFIAFVIDTSGSMRDINHGGLWPIAIRTIEQVLDVYPQVSGVQLLDADGRFVLGRNGSGVQGWLPDDGETRDRMKRTLRRYNQDTVSNPVPGIYNAIRFLHEKDNAEMKMTIFVFGDEFNDVADPVIRRLEDLNPADENGNRKIVINAIGFPTTIRQQFSMGNTGMKYANLMRTITYMHGGAFIALQDL